MFCLTNVSFSPVSQTVADFSKIDGVNWKKWEVLL